MLLSKIQLLGHVIDKKRLHTSDKKVKAIQNALSPRNPKQLKSFLGLLHYYVHLKSLNKSVATEGCKMALVKVVRGKVYQSKRSVV